MKRCCVLLILAGAVVHPLAGQTWDNAGNSLLKGTYYFRYVAWQGQYDATNNLQYGLTVYGNITFSNGAYTLTGAQEYDSGSEAGQPWFVSGTYSLGANGFGILSSLFSQYDYVNILVSQSGILVGSSRTTSTNYNDLLIAAPLTSAVTTPFDGAYSMIGMDDPTLSVGDTRCYRMSLTFGAPAASLTGYFATKGNAAATQSFSDIGFSYSNSAAIVKFGPELSTFNVGTDLMNGTKYFYMSPDRRFVFGGSPNGWDFIVGVRQSSATVEGEYFRAGFGQDDSPAMADSYANLTSWYGALDVLASGELLGHRRILQISPKSVRDYDLTYSDALSGNPGSLSDSFNQYSFSDDGAVGVGFEGLGSGQTLGLEVLVAAPATPPPDGPYIYPTGVMNAGSAAPFTASWAPGELVSIFGINLASTTAIDATLPVALGQVQVLVNGSPAHIYSVSSTQINAVIPVNVSPSTAPVASLQVMNGNAASNTVYNYLNQTQPGVFNGTGPAAAIQHLDYSLVTSANPAKPGETLAVYLTGLGAIDAQGNALNSISATIGGEPAAVIFAGSPSALGGGYQVNLTLPGGVSPGNAYLNFSGPDSTNAETMIPIAAGITPTSSDRPAGAEPRLSKRQ